MPELANDSFHNECFTERSYLETSKGVTNPFVAPPLLSSSIGVNLTDALDELIQSGHINPVLAMKVLTQFDRSVAETLSKHVVAKSVLKVSRNEILEISNLPTLPDQPSSKIKFSNSMRLITLGRSARSSDSNEVSTLTFHPFLLFLFFHQGHLDNYRLCEEVWTFIVKDAQLKLDNGKWIDVDRIKLVACKMPEGAQPK